MNIKVDNISSVQQNLLNEEIKNKEAVPQGNKSYNFKDGKLVPNSTYGEEKKSDSIEKRLKELNEKQKEELIHKLKEKINKLLSPWNIQLDFTIDKDLDKVIVKVKDKDTGKIIRQIPPEEMLRIAKSLEEVSGLLIDLWG